MAGARSLGVLTLDLAVKIGGFEKGMDKAARHTDKRMREIEKSAKRLGKDIGLAFTAAAGAVAAGMGIYIRNTIEAEKVQAQLAARIKSTGGAAGLAVKDLNAMADALQSATTFDDEAIGGAQSILLTFTRIGKDVFPRATEAVLDLSTAMGGSLDAAAKQLGKALNDPIRGVTALADAGVTFSDSQRKMIKALVETGEIAKAQEIILKELETQMGGSARAARDTLGGALQGLKNNFDNLLEGDTTQGGLKGTVDSINNLSDSLNDPGLKRGIDTLANGLLQAANAALQAAGEIGALIGSYQTWLANQGFMQASGGRNMQQLKARRDALQKMLGPVDESKWFDLTGPTPARQLFMEVTGAREGIQEELAEIQRLMANFPVRMVTGKAPGSQKAPALGLGLSETGGGKGRKGREAPDFAKDAADELRKLLEVEEQAREAFASMEAQLAGPLAAAFYQFSVDQERLNEQAKAGAIDTDRLTQAQANLRKAYEADVEAIEARLNPGRQLIEDLEFELSLIGLSNDARETAIALRYAEVAAMSEQGKEIEGLIAKKNRELAIERDQIETMDALRDSARGFLDDLSEGVGIWESLKNAADSFADVLFDIASRKLIEQLFGKQGDSGGGGWGDALGALFGRLWGGGKASGGTVMPGKLYEVGEHDRPEMLMAGGRQYLIPGNAGNVEPMRGGGSGVTQNIAFHLAAPTDPSTQTQIAARAAFEAQRALARNAG